MAKVQFQIFCATNLGNTKVFQSKSTVGSDLDLPGTKDCIILKQDLGYVLFELLLADTETVGTTSITTPPSECFGYIRFPGVREYFVDRVATFNTNNNRVYVAGHVSVRDLDYIPPS